MTIGLGPGGKPDVAGVVAEDPQTKLPERGSSLGRFIVLKTLGVGGMGVVVSAYDPKLERKVALKLLRPEMMATDAGATGARASLLREARAMAQLRHPNVITVFEVGEVQDQVFVAMEHVEGGTLGAWAEERRRGSRSWQSIVRAFVEAGRGLAAAHHEGLVHRDFKPANVLVEGDRVQVTDFGIASIRGTHLRSGGVAVFGATSGEQTIVRGGEPVGTVPYMAPEVLEGKSADLRSDQFSFCVALYESLYGARPFVGDTGERISASILEEDITSPPRGHRVPEWVHRAVVRGLAKDPAKRWPSMEALLETLESPDSAEVGRRTRVAISMGIGAAFVGLPLIARWLGPPFDRSNYSGVLTQTLSLIVLLLVMSYIKRDLVFATPLNRRAFGSVVAVLGMQIPLELTNAALGVSVVASDIQHMVLWSAMATMFAVTFDRRFAVLGVSYLLGVPIAVMFPEQHMFVLGLTNAVFIVFVALVWRTGPVRASATELRDE